MKVLGHPVHSMLIHFPTALLPMDLFFSFFAHNHHNPNLTNAAFYCLVAGTIAGYLAMVAGLFDLAGIPRQNKPAFGNGLMHGFINFTIICIYSLLAYRQYKIYPSIEEPSTATLILKAILVAVLLTGNYLGGTLVYKYLIGTHQMTKHDRHINQRTGNHPENYCR